MTMSVKALRRILFVVAAFSCAASASNIAKAAAPRIQVFNEVEKGLELGLQGGFSWDFSPPVPDRGPGFLVGLEVGYDLNWVFRIKAGFLTQHYSGSATSSKGTHLPMDWESSLVWAGASLSLIATQRFYTYIQAGVGYFAASPKHVGSFEVGGSDDVAILAGGGVEYYLPLRHFSIAVEANVSILPLRGDVALAVFPVLRYTFGVGRVKVIKQAKDRDHDGVPDKDDKCPDIWGPDTNAGCPEKDTDKDGVIDRDDRCPEDAGPASNSGCPLEPDTDGDGVKDKLDRCPKIAGPIDKEGCPDRDDDGIPDYIDKCPDKPGKVETDGCPSKAQVKVRVREKSIELREKIHFEFGKASLKKKSYPILNQVAATLEQYPDIKKLRVEGHTDSKGAAVYNRRLSQRRAQAVVDYLVRKGVEQDRLVAKGFGEDKPIAGNKTERGRSMNRRVEMIILERE